MQHFSEWRQNRFFSNSNLQLCKEQYRHFPQCLRVHALLMYAYFCLKFYNNKRMLRITQDLNNSFTKNNTIMRAQCYVYLHIISQYNILIFKKVYMMAFHFNFKNFLISRIAYSKLLPLFATIVHGRNQNGFFETELFLFKCLNR